MAALLLNALRKVAHGHVRGTATPLVSAFFRMSSTATLKAKLSATHGTFACCRGVGPTLYERA